MFSNIWPALLLILVSLVTLFITCCVHAQMTWRQRIEDLGHEQKAMRRLRVEKNAR